MSKPSEKTRLIRIKEVIHQTGLSRAAVYDLMKQGKFPASIKLSGISVAWVESEVDDFVTSRIAASRTPNSAD